MQTATEISVEPTAHPRARKFILATEARTGTPVTFTTIEDCRHVPLAVALLALDGVSELFFSTNVITITGARGVDWNDLEGRVREALELNLPDHDPAMPKPVAANENTPAQPIGDLAILDGIIDQTIRPYIHSHGGDIELVAYDAETFRVQANYQGTCGHCPASTSGTLEVVQHILREEFDPRVTVEIV